MEIEIFNEFRKDRMFQNANHKIMPSAEQSAHLAGRVMVIDGKSAFVGGKSTNRASVVLGSKSFRIPLGGYSVAALKLFTPLDFSPFWRPLVTINSLTTRLGQTVLALVSSVFRSLDSLLLNRSHSILVTGSLRLSSIYPIGA